MLNKGSLCVCVVAVVLVYIGMYAALCKEIGNIIVGVVCGALIVLYTQKYKVCLHVCVCVVAWTSKIALTLSFR